jgi:DNA-binding PadR family transcriptional regulator
MSATTYPLRGGCGRRGNRFELWLMSGAPEGEHRSRRRRHGRGFRGHGFGPGFGPGRRPRGDIRAAILALLAEEPMHGYQIIQVIAERSGGTWTPSPGSVYPTLQQLEDEGLVEPAESETGRRVFTLTEAGRAAHTDAPGRAPWEEAVDPVDQELVELRDLVQQVMVATRQVAQAGSASQIAGAKDVLRTARKGLYRLLAEDDTES